jgi:hypothetical protein
MPRYLVETTAPVPSGPAPETVAARRCPEVAVELSYDTSGPAGPGTIWLCSAPSVGHIHAWMAASRLQIVELRSVTRRLR